MKRYRFHAFALAAFFALAAVAAGGAGTPTRADAPKASAGGTQTISVISEATAADQKSFQAVLARFEQKNPNYDVKYTSAGRQLVTILSTAVQGGNPPDVALLPQPGLMRDFVARKAL